MQSLGTNSLPPLVDSRLHINIPDLEHLSGNSYHQNLEKYHTQQFNPFVLPKTEIFVFVLTVQLFLSYPSTFQKMPLFLCSQLPLRGTTNNQRNQVSSNILNRFRGRSSFFQEEVCFYEFRAFYLLVFFVALASKRGVSTPNAQPLDQPLRFCQPHQPTY